MNNRIVMSSNTRDSHGDIMTKQALEGIAKDMTGPRKTPWNLNHKRELPPLGQVVNPAIEEKGALVLLTAEMFKFNNRATVEWDKNLMIEFFDTPSPFVSRHKNDFSEMEISLDPSNFSSDQEFEILNRELHELNPSVNLEMHGRKSEIPGPEVLIGIGKAYFLYKMLEPFTKKILEKLAEDTYDKSKGELKKFREYLTRVFKLTRKKMVPKNKRMTLILEVHTDPFIELIIKSDDPAILSKGLSEKRLGHVQTELNKFCGLFEIERIQFVLNGKGNWHFSYLVTAKGEVIGQKALFDERDRQFKKYEMNGLQPPLKILDRKKFTKE